MLPLIRAAAAAYALHRPYEQATIELCRLGQDAVAFGAATLPVGALLALGADPREERQAGRSREERQTGRSRAAERAGVDAA